MMYAYQRMRESRLGRAGLLASICLAAIATPATAEEHVQPPQPRDEPGIHHYLEELERQLHLQEGELEERLENFNREWEKEQERFFRETEAFREEGERALEEFMDHAHRFMEEHEAAIDQRLREFRESAEIMGNEWLERFQAWEEGLDRAHEKELELEGSEPDDGDSIIVVRTEHRPAVEILAEFGDRVSRDHARAVSEYTILLHGSRETLDMLEEAIRNLDTPAPVPGNLSVSFYVIATGDLWESGKPLPERFDAVRAELAVLASGREPVLLDAITYRTRMDKALTVMSHLPDSPSGATQRYSVQIKEVARAASGPAFQLDGLQFETQLYAEDGSRDVRFQLSPELQPKTPTLLGSGSLGGTGELLALIGEVRPAPVAGD